VATTPARNVQILLTNGSVNGLVVATEFNWTGRALSATFSHYDELRHREELDGQGLFILSGPSLRTTRGSRTYVGAGAELRTALDEELGTVVHDVGWDRITALTSSDGFASDQIPQYLKSRLLSTCADLAATDMLQVPSPLPELSEPHRAIAENYLAEMLVMLGVLGITAFTPTQ